MSPHYQAIVQIARKRVNMSTVVLCLSNLQSVGRLQNAHCQVASGVYQSSICPL